MFLFILVLMLFSARFKPRAILSLSAKAIMNFVRKPVFGPNYTDYFQLPQRISKERFYSISIMEKTRRSSTHVQRPLRKR